MTGTFSSSTLLPPASEVPSTCCRLAADGSRRNSNMLRTPLLKSEKSPKPASITAELATVNAAEAQCFKQEDRQRLLAVIEAGFGNFSDFNKCVRSMLVRASSMPYTMEAST